MSVVLSHIWNWLADTIIIQRDELREHFLNDGCMLCLIDSHIRHNMQLGTD